MWGNILLPSFHKWGDWTCSVTQLVINRVGIWSHRDHCTIQCDPSGRDVERWLPSFLLRSRGLHSGPGRWHATCTGTSSSEKRLSPWHVPHETASPPSTPWTPFVQLPLGPEREDPRQSLPTYGICMGKLKAEPLQARKMFPAMPCFRTGVGTRRQCLIYTPTKPQQCI